MVGENPSPIPSKPTPVSTKSTAPKPILSQKPKPTPSPTLVENPPTSKTVENRNLITSLLYVKENNLMRESMSTIKFATVKEAEASAKEEIVTAINEKLNFIKQQISELQKAGYELKLYGIKLLRIPLKTRVWTSTTAKKDLEAIFNALLSVGTIIGDLMKEKEQKDLEKEKKIIEMEEQEKRDDEIKKSQPPLEDRLLPKTKPAAVVKPKPSSIKVPIQKPTSTTLKK